MSAEQKNRDANALLGSAVGVGAISAVGAAIGLICPACVVAVPALVGVGLVQKLRARSEKRQEEEEDAAAPA